MLNKIILTNKSLPITIHRGDTLDIACVIDLINSPIEIHHYALKENDRLYVGIMEGNQLFEHALIKKTLDFKSNKTFLGDPIMHIDTIDTQFVSPGTYCLSAKLLRGIGDSHDIITVIPAVVINII